MSYEVKSSEKQRKIGAEAETKALLYLMNFRDDSDEIYYFVVDFFNDLTGMDRFGEKLWDLQSKSNKNVGPKDIGRELVTLFKNYMSEIEFHTYILFVGSVSNGIRIDSEKKVFGISNVNADAVQSMKAGLKAEGEKKKYINSSDLTEENIAKFLGEVLFVVDEGKKKSEYVQGIIRRHPNITADEDVWESIFNEICQKQSGKKDGSSVEGITIETTDEALNYCRHLTNNEIRLLTLNRLIQKNPLDRGVPPSFVDIYTAWPPQVRKERLEECYRSMCMALFNKSAADGFWELFDKTYHLILDRPNDSVQILYRELVKEKDCIGRCPNFDADSLKYFIATVKDGIQQ